MSNSLTSFVEEFILNTNYNSTPNIEDEDNEDTRAVVSEKILGEEGAKATYSSVSSLRIKNAKLLGESDPRYSGKITKRKNIKKEEENDSYDPDLAKFCILEEESDSDESFNKNDTQKNKQKLHETEKHLPSELINDESCDDAYMNLAEDIEEDSGDEDEDDNDDDDDDDDDDDYEENEDDDNEEDYDDYHDIDQNNSDNDVEEHDVHKKLKRIKEKRETEKNKSGIQTFSKEDSVQISKGFAVKNQYGIFDKFFEARIGLQKVASLSNQLPQADVYQDFLKNKYYPLYKTNLLEARKMLKKLMFQILELQETLLLKNSETKKICNENRITDDDTNDTEELEKGDDENLNYNKNGKRKLEEIGETLRKRHKFIKHFRDETLDKWHEKAMLLGNDRNNFGNFEITPSLQIQNILSNKDQLIKRTQLIGASRGNAYKILGKDKEATNLVEEYDPEIFDDSDFYSRMLEDFLKSKIAHSNNMTEVSIHWVDIQKLRKKSKKIVDTKASKGRKIRYQEITKQQHFHAPSKPCLISDDATNKLFTSLFGQ